IDVMRALGLTSDDVKARVSDRRVLGAYLRTLGVSDEVMLRVMTDVVDKLGRSSADSSGERLIALGVPARAIEPIVSLERTTLDDIRRTLHDAHDASEASVDDFERYLSYVHALIPDGAEWIKFDASIVRGLAYYTGIVFELFDAKGELRAICGGGRYDNLLATLGDVDLPAIGFGMGDVVLRELLQARGLLNDVVPSLDYWVATARQDTEALVDVMDVARQLRAKDQRVEYALREQSLGRQLKAASAAGARFAAIVELNGQVSRKDLRDTTQVTITIDQLIEQAGHERGNG
ncbi:MAG TPA: ATP phosphoribosyltransferase regulatory subunit, partial [Gemmatimonadaceae bacterium]|nr:ATP phosphoribosyltransferase regulatory subunit [Gemmatimonadaceae bacterium]